MQEEVRRRITRLLASADPAEIRRGLTLVRAELSRASVDESRFLFDVIAIVFYVDLLDRPELAAVVDEALGLVVRMGAAIIPALVERLDGGDVKAQLACAHALGRLGSEAVAPLIAEYERADDPTRRSFILYALGKVRSSAVAQALPLAVEAAASDALELQDTATRTLGLLAQTIHAGAMPEDTRRQVVERLMANSHHPSPAVRAKAFRSLARLTSAGHIQPGEAEALRAACEHVLGQECAGRAFIVCREATEALSALEALAKR